MEKGKGRRVEGFKVRKGGDSYLNGNWQQEEEDIVGLTACHIERD